MYAIFRSGGRQYRAEIGAELDLERLPQAVGDRIKFDEVLLLGDDKQTKIGKPLVKGASVNATVVDQYKGKKIIVWKYRPRQGYRRKKGHRQYYTRLRIEDIVPPKAKSTTTAKSEAKSKTEKSPAGESAAAKKKPAPSKSPAAKKTSSAKKAE